MPDPLQELLAAGAVPTTSFPPTSRYAGNGVDAHDPLTFVAVSTVLLVFAAAASLVPALRILRLDPARILKG